MLYIAQQLRFFCRVGVAFFLHDCTMHGVRRCVRCALFVLFPPYAVSGICAQVFSCSCFISNVALT